MDICDDATESDEKFMAISVKAVRRELDQPSSTHCDDCGEEIPKDRLALVPGCRTCIKCQIAREK